MAIVQVSNAASRNAYEAIDRLLDLTSNRPTGMLMHTASENADGSVLLVDVWESDDAMDLFEKERLFPALEAGGQGAAMQEPPTRHQVFKLVQG